LDVHLDASLDANGPVEIYGRYTVRDFNFNIV